MEFRRSPSPVLALMCVVCLLGVPGALRAQSPPSPSVGLLPPTIPIFPLPDVALFPNITRPIHVFEPRYRAMVVDALKGDRIIGIVLLQPGYQSDYEGRPPVYPVGCAGMITRVEELPDGRFLLELSGLVKFRIGKEDQTRVYRLADVEAIPESSSDEERAALAKARQRIVALLATLVPGSEPPPPEIEDEELVNGLSQNLSFDPADRQDLLEQKGPLERSTALIKLLESHIPPR